jgi:hypothetical protein
MTDRDIARIAYEANRAWCAHNGDMSFGDWDDAPEWQVESMLDGVVFHTLNPYAPPEATHENWLKMKTEDGWVWGEVKDPEAKTHPCMVPFDQLPPEQQFKDKLFRAIVHAALEGTAHG